MKKRAFKPGDKVMLLKDDMRKMKVVGYVVDIQKIDGWNYWECPIWEDEVLVECTWPDKLNLPHYDVFSEDELLLIQNEDSIHPLSNLKLGNSRVESAKV